MARPGAVINSTRADEVSIQALSPRSIGRMVRSSDWLAALPAISLAAALPVGSAAKELIGFGLSAA